MNRRTFLGLSGASVLAGLVKPVAKLIPMKPLPTWAQMMSKAVNDALQQLEGGYAIPYLISEPWGEWVTFKYRAADLPIVGPPKEEILVKLNPDRPGKILRDEQHWCSTDNGTWVEIAPNIWNNRQPMDIRVQWYEEINS